MMPVVAIVSPKQSGSTILTYLLGAHPEIATVGEVQVPPGNDACSCGASYAECSFWKNVTEGMNRRGFPFDICQSELDFILPQRGISNVLLRAGVRGPLLESARNAGMALMPRARREITRLLDRNEVFIDVVTSLKGAAVFLDSTKRASRALHLRRRSKLDVKIIHLIRDGRANSWSAMRHGDRSAAQAASHWLACHTEAERARRYFPPDHWIDIRHEDVCAHPEEVLAKLHAFIGIEVVPKIGDFRAEQHILGNERTRGSSSRQISLDERWKKDLSHNELSTIDRILGDLNGRYGYNSLVAA